MVLQLLNSPGIVIVIARQPKYHRFYALILIQETTVNDSAANLTENVKRKALSQKLGCKSCLVTNHRYLVTTQPPTNSHEESYTT